MAMFQDPRMDLLILTLWRNLPGLYIERYDRDPAKWLPSKIDENFDFSQALGMDHQLFADMSQAMGQGHITKSFRELIMGSYAKDSNTQNPLEWIPSDRLITIGNGTDDQNRSDALIIYKYGLIRFFNAITLGAYNSPQGQLPFDGSIQYTPENGPQYWENGKWNPFGGELQGPNTYLELNDTTDENYTSKAGYVPTVNAQETGLELIGSQNALFTLLNDCPPSYEGNQGRMVAVNASQTGLEFIDAPQVGSAPGTITPTSINEDNGITHTHELQGLPVELGAENGVHKADGKILLGGELLANSDTVIGSYDSDKVFMAIGNIENNNSVDQQAGINLSSGNVIARSQICARNISGETDVRFFQLINFPSSSALVQDHGFIHFDTNQLITEVQRTIETIRNGYSAGIHLRTLDTSNELYFKTCTPNGNTLILNQPSQFTGVNSYYMPVTVNNIAADASGNITIETGDNYVDGMSLGTNALLTLTRTGTLPDLTAQFGTMANKNFWTGTLADYNAISPKDANTIYHIEE